MNNLPLSGKEREAPHSHLIQALTPIIFLTVWILDSFIFNFSTFLNAYIPLYIQLPFFSLFFILSLVLMQLSHKDLFDHNQPSQKLITEGILGHVRNPLYLSILLIYLSVLFLSLSLISVAIYLIIIILYNWMVNKEEKILFEMFGDEFLEYKKNVPKWIPKF